jgi:hypothetical protein
MFQVKLPTFKDKRCEVDILICSCVYICSSASQLQDTQEEAEGKFKKKTLGLLKSVFTKMTQPIEKNHLW